MGRGADWVVERGPFRVERFGPRFEVFERTGGYRLSLLSKSDRQHFRALLDLMDCEEAGERAVLVLGERRMA